jgi:hypothetical protein
MKQVTKCVSCDTIVGIYKSYKVHIKDRIKTLLTGEIKEVEYEGRVCPECAAKAGYKVGRKYLSKTPEKV